MNNKELIIIVIAIIAGCCIIAGAIMITGSDTPEIKNSTVNNTTDNTTTNITDNSSDDVQSQQSNGKTHRSSSSSEYTYDPSSDTYKKSGSSHNYIRYGGEWVDTSIHGQFEGSSQSQADAYHPEY